jgi:hypothetical protein
MMLSNWPEIGTFSFGTVNFFGMHAVRDFVDD